MSDQARTALPALPRATARAVVDDAIRTYFRTRRSLVPAFVDRNFSLNGALKIHARAVGHDLWRAPLNTMLVVPALALDAAANGLDRLGRRGMAARLRARELFFKTDVARELEWLLYAELLQLPYADGRRIHARDALADLILSDPRIGAVLEPLNGPWGEAERLRLANHLATKLAQYGHARTAAGELATMLATSGAGALLLHQFTPGFLTLGPALAGVIAQNVAVAGFPAGAALGAAFYAMSPAAPGAALVAATTTGVLAGASVASAFAGIVTDPVQRALGLHHRRLVALLDALEAGFLGDEAARLIVRDHYAARLLDLIDIVVGAFRFTRGM